MSYSVHLKNQLRATESQLTHLRKRVERTVKTLRHKYEEVYTDPSSPLYNNEEYAYGCLSALFLLEIPNIDHPFSSRAEIIGALGLIDYKSRGDELHERLGMTREECVEYLKKPRKAK